MTKKLTLPLALVVAAAFSASPAVAQKGHGNGHGNSGKHQANVERRDRDRDRDDDVSWQERQRREEAWQREQRVIQAQRNRTASRSTNSRLQRRVPPGWCIGRGNPHNTVANCGAGSNRYDRRYDPRYSTSRNGTVLNSRSYSEWKRIHD